MGFELCDQIEEQHGTTMNNLKLSLCLDGKKQSSFAFWHIWASNLAPKLGHRSRAAILQWKPGWIGFDGTRGSGSKWINDLFQRYIVGLTY